jgi:hypothetical protein
MFFLQCAFTIFFKAIPGNPQLQFALESALSGELFAERNLISLQGIIEREGCSGKILFEQLCLVQVQIQKPRFTSFTGIVEIGADCVAAGFNHIFKRVRIFLQ